MGRSLHISMLGFIATGALAGCATTKSLLALEDRGSETRPIHNPFGDYYANAENDKSQNIILRTKKGDRSVEVELPKTSQDMTDFVIPVSPHFKDTDRNPASDGSSPSGIDESFKDRRPSISDREITASLPAGAAENEGTRREIEAGLGLVPTDELPQEQDKSYLGSIDHVKQLFRSGRYEAALIELDSLLRLYQTDAKLYEMRGTLLDRLGKTDLALKSWNQALRIEPSNQSLRRFVERRQQNRGLASP